jgi:hypothetical protein
MKRSNSPLSVLSSLCLAAVSALAVATLAACDPSPSGAANPTVANVTGADTPVPADHQCNFANYRHDESRNSGGAAKCASDCDCDGMRSCSAGTCQGTARPATMTAAACNNKDFHYNESWTAAGAGKCSGDCQCDGLRTCVAGQCSGTAR